MAHRKIKISNKYFTVYTLVDNDVYKYLQGYKWYAYYDNNSMRIYTYIMKAGRSKMLWLHRLITSCPKGKVVDHINGNSLDNRLKNLRICTRSQNNLNIGKSFSVRSSSKYLGVTYYPYNKKNPWKATISHKNKTLNLGYFKTEIEAARYRDKKALQLRKQYARLNFKE